MNFLSITGIVIFVVWAYVLFVRPKVLAAFPKIAEIETKLWAGSRQVLMARVMSLGGVIVAVHDWVMASGADTSSLLHEIANFLPEKYQPLALAGVLFVGGVALEWLRRVTDGPVGSSLPPKAD
jgi:hypothetical protein